MTRADHIAFLAASARQWRNVDARRRAAGSPERASALRMAREYEAAVRRAADSIIAQGGR